MADLYISEFEDLPFVTNGVLQAANAASWQQDQKIAIGATSAPSAALSTKTNYVVLSADAVCSIAWTKVGQATVAATANNLRIPANVPLLFGVAPGMIVSNITNT